MNRAVLVVSVAALGAVLSVSSCSVTAIPAPSAVASFLVENHGVYVRVPLADGGGLRVPLGVSSSCVAQYADGGVPNEVRGTKGCRYLIPRGPIEIDVGATALDRNGQAMRTFNGPVAFKVLPGDLSNDVTGRWGTVVDGVLQGTVKATHQYGQVRVWVEDAPPEPLYVLFDAGVDGGVDGGEVVDVAKLPNEPATRTYASGLSPTNFFEDQTMQRLQMPDGFDNRSSPFVGEFVSVGKNPESGERLLQNCAADPARNGQQSLMVVTGIDPSGFFVTDITGCRLIEQPTDATGRTIVRTAEPPEPCLVTLADGGTTTIDQTTETSGTCQISQRTCTKGGSQCARYLPGTFGSMFVFNYNFPDGLNQGDLLFTVSGSIQEFTSTTQMVFPGWTIAESVRLLPPEQWNKWLNFVKPPVINGRLCGLDDSNPPFVTDALCGMSSTNLKLESLESSLVRVKGVRFPKRFVNCDYNGDGTVPFFCNRSDRDEQNRTIYSWGNCDFNVPPAPEAPNDTAERTCLQNCVLNRGENRHDGFCSEKATFDGFGQFVVEMAAPGPAWARLDDSLGKRITSVVLPAADGGVATPVTISGLSFDTSRGYEAGASIALACDVPVSYRDALAKLGGTLAAAEVAELDLDPTEDSLVVTSMAGAGTCSVSFNPHMMINLITKDSIPELNVNCDEADTVADRATQCKYLHGATFDVMGHLKQVQPGRPRWVVTPRDPDDVCCYPGEGLGCPKPIKACAQ